MPLLPWRGGAAQPRSLGPWLSEECFGPLPGLSFASFLGVKAGSWTILEIVEALGSCLENTEPRTRGRGLQLLSQVLLHCHSLTHLVLFYENRPEGSSPCDPAVLQGLHALSLCEVLAPGLAVSVLKAIFQEVHVQSLPQLDRHTVYSIITNFMHTREEGEGWG
uniref:MMS19 nucleotide excision repair protein n=1 Tax=Gopherus evgoodei TaxID=1825980 RepID=A0A8C4XY90_9SAUR